MNRFLIISILFVLGACSTKKDVNQEEQKTNPEPINVVSENYELIVPEKQDGFLILFPCFPCDAENTRTEFNIVDIASANNITVLLMNFNQHLWLSDSEKKGLEEMILDVVKQNDINIDNTYIGGFSSGGNVALLLTDYLKSTKSSIPKSATWDFKIVSVVFFPTITSLILGMAAFNSGILVMAVCKPLLICVSPKYNITK